VGVQRVVGTEVLDAGHFAAADLAVAVAVDPGAGARHLHLRSGEAAVAVFIQRAVAGRALPLGLGDLAVAVEVVVAGEAAQEFTGAADLLLVEAAVAVEVHPQDGVLAPPVLAVPVDVHDEAALAAAHVGVGEIALRCSLGQARHGAVLPAWLADLHLRLVGKLTGGGGEGELLRNHSLSLPLRRPFTD